MVSTNHRCHTEIWLVLVSFVRKLGWRTRTSKQNVAGTNIEVKILVFLMTPFFQFTSYFFITSFMKCRMLKYFQVIEQISWRILSPVHPVSQNDEFKKKLSGFVCATYHFTWSHTNAPWNFLKTQQLLEEKNKKAKTGCRSCWVFKIYRGSFRMKSFSYKST